MANTTDSRTVHTDALATLGTIIGPNEKRDAIHLAVIPMKSTTHLTAGTHVDKDGNPTVPYSSDAVGMVDPFLRDVVRSGDWFWLVIYPRVITSLRHVWAHPSFEDEVASDVALKPDRSGSELWMRNWAIRHLNDDGRGGARTGDEAYAFALRIGDEHHVGANEEARDHIGAEWWGHWEAITGRPGDRNAYFSCGC